MSSKNQPKKGGRGTHGSLSKAGKMREQQPKNWKLNERKTKHNIPQKHIHKHKVPRMSNRRKYEKRFGLGRKSGQNKVK
jgi:ribosomal protein S30